MWNVFKFVFGGINPPYQTRFGSTDTMVTGELPKIGKAPRGALASKPKGPARPHRKLPAEKLESRVKEMVKKKLILESKLVLLNERLTTLQTEDSIRKKAADDVGAGDDLGCA